jgi:hypothetical protein
VCCQKAELSDEAHAEGRKPAMLRIDVNPANTVASIPACIGTVRIGHKDIQYNRKEPGGQDWPASTSGGRSAMLEKNAMNAPSNGMNQWKSHPTTSWRLLLLRGHFLAYMHTYTNIHAKKHVNTQHTMHTPTTH